MTCGTFNLKYTRSKNDNSFNFLFVNINISGEIFCSILILGYQSIFILLFLDLVYKLHPRENELTSSHFFINFGIQPFWWSAPVHVEQRHRRYRLIHLLRNYAQLALSKTLSLNELNSQRLVEITCSITIRILLASRADAFMASSQVLPHGCVLKRAVKTLTSRKAPSNVGSVLWTFCVRFQNLSDKVS